MPEIGPVLNAEQVLEAATRGGHHAAPSSGKWRCLKCGSFVHEFDEHCSSSVEQAESGGHQFGQDDDMGGWRDEDDFA